MTLEVLEPGLLTTVQDAGRPDWAHLGVPLGGAADPWSLAVANLLAGADAGAAALEMTIIGPTLGVREPVTIGLAGADLGGIVRETGRRLLPGRTSTLEANTTIAFPGGATGARAYLAVPGGIDVPAVLGSASTLLSAGFGGVEGRALRAGDVLRAAAPAGPLADRAWPWIDGDPVADLSTTVGPRILRMVPGPADGADVLLAGGWQVRPDSDRVGIRLERIGGGDLPTASGGLLTHGVVRGAVQLPPGGVPMILLADHQTTGGYPVAAVVAIADLPRLGQLRPGDHVRFSAVSIEQARDAWLQQGEVFARGEAALSGESEWDDLWRSAGR